MNTLKKFFTIVSSLITIFSTTNKSYAVTSFLTNMGSEITTFVKPGKIFDVIRPTSIEKISTTFQTEGISSVKTATPVVGKTKNKQQEISEMYRQLCELHKINCNLDELKNASVENCKRLISGVTFYGKLYAHYNYLLDFNLQPTQNVILAFSRMIDFLCRNNKDIRYLIQMPSIVEYLMHDSNLFNTSEESQTFSIKFFDELWLSGFLCMADNFNSSFVDVYNIKRYNNWNNVKEDSQKEYVMNLIVCKTATLYELILNKLYTTDYLLKELVTHDADNYGFLVDSFVFKKRNDLLKDAQILYNGFRDDIVKVWLLNLRNFLCELRDTSYEVIEARLKKEINKWIRLSQAIYKGLGINKELKIDTMPVFCKDLLAIISSNPELIKEKISSEWHQWLILSLFLAYEIRTKIIMSMYDSEE